MLKRTAGFNKAMEELSMHQQLLESATHDTDEQSSAENDLDENQVIDLAPFSTHFVRATKDLP